MRRASIAAGAVLVVLAFAAATQVADTRAGLIAEVITLLAALAGIGLLIYGLTSRRTAAPTALRPGSNATATAPRPRTGRDLLLGVGGVLLALVLVSGLAVSGGVLWAAFGLALLLPMIAGCVYLCVRFLRANP